MSGRGGCETSLGSIGKGGKDEIFRRTVFFVDYFVGQKKTRKLPQFILFNKKNIYIYVYIYSKLSSPDHMLPNESPLPAFKTNIEPNICI